MPKLCSGISERLPCIYCKADIGQPAQGKTGKCMFCDPEKMTSSCSTVRGRQNVTQALKAFRAFYDTHSYVYNSAMMLVPDEWRATFHKEALKRKRGKSKKPRQPRKVASPDQAKKVAEDWTVSLRSCKRAFADLSSEEVTAYKKHRQPKERKIKKTRERKGREKRERERRKDMKMRRYEDEKV